MTHQQSHQQFKPGYFLQRPHSPINTVSNTNSTKNLSLTMSIGANQTAHAFFPNFKTKQQLPQQPFSNTSIPNCMNSTEKIQNQLKNISKQNAFLREENEFLKRELKKIKRQYTQQNVRSSQKYDKYSSISPQPSNDLRGTIKKQMGEIKEMKLKLDMLSRQCKMYEEIIDKMEDRIKKITHDNQKKNAQIDELQSELTRLDQLKEKTNLVMRMYNDLQSKSNDHQLEWMKWKQNWQSQKEYYLDRLKQLQKTR